MFVNLIKGKINIWRLKRTIEVNKGSDCLGAIILIIWTLSYNFGSINSIAAKLVLTIFMEH